jgi:hypothetical protein
MAIKMVEIPGCRTGQVSKTTYQEDEKDGYRSRKQVLTNN